eukprot:12432372-Heterocapsa_arctica.AAC.1
MARESVTTSGGGARARTLGNIRSEMRPTKGDGNQGCVAAELLPLVGGVGGGVPENVEEREVLRDGES